MPTLTTYLAHAPLDVVQPLVEQVFTAAGWQVTSAPAGTSPQAVRLSARYGSRLRTLLLGGGAGASFHLHHQLLLTPVAKPRTDLPLLGPGDPGADPEPGKPTGAAATTSTRIDYPTTGAQAITRGGIYGAEREHRSHDHLSQQITTALQAAGIEVGSL